MQRVEIWIEGCLDRQWEEWFEGVEISPVENGDTILTGHVMDQAALFGIIAKLRDLGVTVLAIKFEEKK